MIDHSSVLVLKSSKPSDPHTSLEVPEVEVHTPLTDQQGVVLRTCIPSCIHEAGMLIALGHEIRVTIVVRAAAALPASNYLSWVCCHSVQ